MINLLLQRLFHGPTGVTAEATLGYEGISWGTAFLLACVLGVFVWVMYRWGGKSLIRWRRILLTFLRIALLVVFLLLLVKPVALVTLNEPVRERLLVLLDVTQSMGIKDRRTSNEDLNRVAIAMGLLPPNAKIDGSPPSSVDQYRTISRADLIKAIAANEKLNLFPRLQEKADLEFYRFDRSLGKLGPIGTQGMPLGLSSAKQFFEGIRYDGESTAIGDSLRELLDENRGQPVAGILIVSDGGNNAGDPPTEAAELSKRDGVPLYLYGTGIERPKDIAVLQVNGPRGAFLKEKAKFEVKVNSIGFSGTPVSIKLKANGRIVDELKVNLGTDGTAEYQLGYEPQEKGEVKIEASVDPREGESSQENNSAFTKVRVLDNQVKVLYVEGEPRWDFRYLLSTLQQDRRISVKSVLFDGGDDLAGQQEGSSLSSFPSNRSDLVSNEIIIMGDVDPKALGEEKMKLINEWVGELGGGLIFLAGRKHNPFDYAGTPLEPLLPVNPVSGLTPEQQSESTREPIQLKLTAAGTYSPLFRLSDDTLANKQIWNSFPGVRWTARVAGARPTAEVLLVDESSDHSANGEPMPIIAQQSYGKGFVMYFGFDETYKWRSRQGLKYYSKIWNQIIQNFSLDRQLGASARTQIKPDREEYMVGDKVVISGKLFSQTYEQIKDPSVAGTLVYKGDEEGAIEETSEMRLSALTDQPGSYQLEFTATKPGKYTFSTLMDPKALLHFSVTATKIEYSDLAMNASLLQSMAGASGGKFLREENLLNLPELVSSRAATIPTYKKHELFYYPLWMVVLICLACLEWLLRRLWELK